MDLNVILIAILGAACAMLIAVGILLPKLNNESKSSERLKNVKENRKTRMANVKAKEDASVRRRDVKDTLKAIEEQTKEQKKISLAKRIEQAGLKIPESSFYMYSAATAVVMVIIGFIFQAPIYVLAGLAFVGGVGLPRFVLNYLKKRRIKLFTNELPEAVDIIVRGIKSGLPLNDGMRLVANEAKEPLASEFRAVVEAQQLGVPVPEAIQNLTQNIPIPETKFFATVIAIQSTSGGSLSEALANLSKILRDRKKLQAKIKAMSAEAKASAGIIGSLPIVVSSLIYVISPDYIGLLFSTSSGNIVLAIGAALMGMGVLVMRGMINFEI